MRAACQRQAIVWDAIERLAFRPSSATDRSGWLWCYVRSLAKLWGVEETSVEVNENTEFTFKDLSIRCAYGIERFDHYGITIGSIEGDEPSWQLHVEPGYCSRSSFYHPDERYPTQDMATHLEHEVKAVLDGMIFHPRNHTHGGALGIVSAFEGEPTLSSGNIRLGGGIENGFVFLTHLRYQFCLLSDDARQAERKRLTGLFADAVRERLLERGQSIPAARLFGLRT